MKIFSLSLLILSLGFGQLQAQSIDDEGFFKAAKEFMVRYTRGDKVDYGILKEDTGLLDTLVAHISTFDSEGKTVDFLKAYYINAYNILVIKEVIDHYPIKSPMDIAGFFSEKKFMIGNKKLTLDELQEQMLTGELKDERIHFALACASESCPLMDAYTPDQLEFQLNVAREQFLTMDKHLKITKDYVYVSRILEWYHDEFEEASFRKSVRYYIDINRPGGIPENTPLKFKVYDWSLNDLN